LFAPVVRQPPIVVLAVFGQPEGVEVVFAVHARQAEDVRLLAGVGAGVAFDVILGYFQRILTGLRAVEVDRVVCVIKHEHLVGRCSRCVSRRAAQ